MKRFVIKTFLVSALILVSVGVLVPQSAQAQSLWAGMEECRTRGDCELNDFVRLADNVAQWILGIVGSLALLMFVYGGVTWIISGGSSEQVQKGKDTVKNAVIGLVLVFASWLLVSVVVRALTCGGEVECSGNIFDRPWQQVE